MSVVCLPSEAASGLADALPAGVDVVVWDGQAEHPDRLAQTELWVPEFGWHALDRLGDVLAAMPSLRVIQLTSAGYDHLAGRIPDGIVLCNGRGIHGGSTAEWVLAAVLACLREIPRFVLAAAERRWDYGITDELAGKRVLIVGAGDLGRQTARRISAFDAEPVLVARTARDGVHGLAELPDLLPAADVVVMVVPKTDETIGMVDARFLARMHDGALLVNASRGPIVVTGALLAELESGRLRAALDVTDPEPLPRDHPLWTAPNVLVTPHVGGSVLGFLPRARALIRDQIVRYASGQPLVNVVDARI